VSLWWLKQVGSHRKLNILGSRLFVCGEHDQPVTDEGQVYEVGSETNL
jgi:hypothetical protein